MKLISDHIPSKVKYLVEASEFDKNEKNWYIEGIFLQADTPNKNKRIYPKSILESAVEQFIKDKVEQNTAVGELDHPEGPTINSDRVSHRITEMYWDGNNVIGKALVLDTPMGNIIKGFIKGGVKIGVSSRGLGSVYEEKGVSYVEDDYKITTVDAVHDPSAPSAFVNGILEGVEFIRKGNQLVESVTKEIKQSKIINNNNPKTRNDKVIGREQARLFEAFLNSLSK